MGDLVWMPKFSFWPRVDSLFKKQGIIRWPIWGGGTKPDNFSRCKNFSEMPKKLGLRPENKGGPKIEKKVVFWHKKSENFRIRYPIFFFQKKFNPPMRPKRHFALKGTFPTETIVKNNDPKIPKISKILLSYFSKKKIEKKTKQKIVFFSSAPAAPRHHFFFRRLRRLFFFFFFFFVKGK